MPKKFYTERDIEDMAARGELSLQLSDDIVLTELAFERADHLGVQLLQPHALPPSAPVRPYLSEQAAPSKPCPAPKSTGDETLRQRIRDAVRNRLGDQVDPTLLETIISRVLNNVGSR